MEVVPTCAVLDGNTNSSKTMTNPCKHWCFTFNNYTCSNIIELENCFKKNCKKYIFQKEIGEKGTPHLQGYCMFNNKLRPSSLLLDKKIHWEKTRNINASIDYCRKAETAKGEVYTNIVFKEPIAILEPSSLYKWQDFIVNIINKEPDNRLIYWFWEDSGNAGKSTFAKYLVVKHNALMLSNKACDMKYGIITYMKKNVNYPKLIIIDIPRSVEDKFLSYTGIEEIKNACFFSPKFESDMVIGNCPHVIVFANRRPDTYSMSIDRWDIYNIDTDF